MSVNTEMTAIADKIRFYTEETEKLSLVGIKDSIDKVNLKGRQYGEKLGYINGGLDFGNTTTVTGQGCVSAHNVHHLPHNINVSLQGDNFSDVKVIRKNKNLFNPSVLLNATGWTEKNGVYAGDAYRLRECFHPSTSGKALFTDFKKGVQYTFSFKGYINTETAVQSLGFFFRYSDGTTTVKYLITDFTESEVTLVSEKGKDVTELFATVSSSRRVSITDLQLEEGMQKTDYIEYCEEEFLPDNNGKINNITSVSPYMNFTCSDNNMNIQVEYLQESIH